MQCPIAPAVAGAGTNDLRLIKISESCGSKPKFQVETVDGDAIRFVPLNGLFDMSAASRVWDLCDLDSGRYSKYVFDFVELREISMAGIAWLLMFERRAKRSGRQVQFINCNPIVAGRCREAGLIPADNGFLPLGAEVPAPLTYLAESIEQAIRSH